MKKPTYLPYAGILFSALTILLVSCGKQQQSSIYREVNTIRTDTTLFLLADEKPSPSYHIRLSVDYLTSEQENDSVAKYINQSVIRMVMPQAPEQTAIGNLLKTLVQSYSDAYKSDVYALYMADRKQNRYTEKDIPSWYNYEVENTLQLTAGKDSMYNACATLYLFTGGAHPNTVLTTLNFDGRTGKPLRKADVFIAEAEKSATDVLMRYLIKAANEKLDTDTITSVQGLHDNGILLDGELTLPDNFLLKKDGIEFIFNTYDIAPYALGSFRITVPYEDLKNYLKIH